MAKPPLSDAVSLMLRKLRSGETVVITVTRTGFEINMPQFVSFDSAPRAPKRKVKKVERRKDALLYVPPSAVAPATPRHRTSNALLADVRAVPAGAAPPVTATPRSVATRASSKSRTTTGAGKARVWTPYRVSPPPLRRLAVAAPRRYPPRILLA
jgi:hypothetical protein